MQRYAMKMAGQYWADLTCQEANEWTKVIIADPTYQEHEGNKVLMDLLVHQPDNSDTRTELCVLGVRQMELETTLIALAEQWCSENVERTEILAAQYLTMAEVVDAWDHYKDGEPGYHNFKAAISKVVNIIGDEGAAHV